MFDFLRNLGRSAEEKEQELLNAYVDDALTQRDRARFEARLRESPALQAEVEATRRLKSRLRGLPPVKAPRNFTLDPAVYGKPTSPAIFQLYPFARAATVLTAFFLVVTVALGVVTGGGPVGIADQAASEPAVAMTQSVAEAPLAADAPPDADDAADSAAAVAADVMEEAAEQAADEVMAEAEEGEISLFEADDAAESAGAPLEAAEDVSGVAPVESVPLEAMGTPSPEAATGDGLDLRLPRETPTTALETEARGGSLSAFAPTAAATGVAADTMSQVVEPTPEPAEVMPPPQADTATEVAVGLALLLVLLLPLTLFLRSRQ